MLFRLNLELPPSASSIPAARSLLILMRAANAEMSVYREQEVAKFLLSSASHQPLLERISKTAEKMLLPIKGDFAALGSGRLNAHDCGGRVNSATREVIRFRFPHLVDEKPEITPVVLRRHQAAFPFTWGCILGVFNAIQPDGTHTCVPCDCALYLERAIQNEWEIRSPIQPDGTD